MRYFQLSLRDYQILTLRSFPEKGNLFFMEERWQCRFQFFWIQWTWLDGHRPKSRLCRIPQQCHKQTTSFRGGRSQVHLLIFNCRWQWYYIVHFLLWSIFKCRSLGQVTRKPVAGQKANPDRTCGVTFVQTDGTTHPSLIFPGGSTAGLLDALTQYLDLKRSCQDDSMILCEPKSKPRRDPYEKSLAELRLYHGKNPAPYHPGYARGNTLGNCHLITIIFQ